MNATDGSPSAEKPPSRSPLRKAGLVVVALASVYLSLGSTYRILSTTLFPDPGSTKFDCRGGTAALYKSVERARERTATLSKPEREALAIFRAELEPTWSQVNAVRTLCKKDGDVTALKTLRSVTLLRYAEERAVRYQAIDLTRWRQRTPKEVKALTSP